LIVEKSLFNFQVAASKLAAQKFLSVAFGAVRDALFHPGKDEKDPFVDPPI
jgi:hypothetical protein